MISIRLFLRSSFIRSFSHSVPQRRKQIELHNIRKKITFICKYSFPFTNFQHPFALFVSLTACYQNQNHTSSFLYRAIARMLYVVQCNPFITISFPGPLLYMFVCIYFFFNFFAKHQTIPFRINLFIICFECYSKDEDFLEESKGNLSTFICENTMKGCEEGRTL